MSRVVTLMWREWREFRSVAGGCAILALAASLFVQMYMFDFARPDEAAGKLAPFLAAFFPAIAAADIVSADARSRRLESLAILPVGAHTIWWAKVLFLLISGALFFVYVFLLQVAIPVVAGNVREGMFAFKHFGGRGFLALPIGYLVGFAVLFFSTLSLRSFVSMMFGAALIGGIAWLLTLPDLEAIRDSGAWKAWLFVATGLALLIASRVAFVAGRVSTGARLRPAITGVGTLLLLLVPTYVHAAVRSAGYYDLSTVDSDVSLRDLRVSPDSKYLSVTARRWGTHHAPRTWVVRTHDGATFSWSVPGQHALAWTRQGFLRTRPGRGQMGARSGRWLDPETGRRQRMPATKREFLSYDVRPDAVPRWGTRRLAGPDDQDGSWVRVARTGEEFNVVAEARLLPGEGEVLEFVEGRYVHRDLLSGKTRSVCRTDVDSAHAFRLWGYQDHGWRAFWGSKLSPSRRFLLSELGGKTSVVEIATGRTVWGPEALESDRSAFDRAAVWVWAANGVDLLQVKSAGEHRLVQPESGRELSLDHLTASAETAISQVQPISADRIAVVRDDYDAERCEVLLLDETGRIIRVLYSSETVAASQGKGNQR